MLVMAEPLRLVIFDCDGVLIDSEGPASRVCAEMITEAGWPMTTEQSMALFMGYRLSDMPPVIEAHLGRPLPPGWVEAVRKRLIHTLSTESTMIPGARAAIDAVLAMGLPFRVASNSSHEEMRVKFAQTGLADLMAGRVHSARDVKAGKPAPDVFLAAAAAEGVPPAACLVIEDSLPGTRGAVAAGMAVIGFHPAGDGAALRAAGAIPIRSFDELPALLRMAMQRAA